MKKLLTLAMAGCFVLGSLGTAAALDVKVNGQYQFAYGYYSHQNMMEASKNSGKQVDRLRMRQRMRVQVQFIADENLSAMLNTEIGDLNWGDAGSSTDRKNAGGLDADGYDFKVKRAYLDWTLPGTQVKTRMGVQGIALPNVVGGNPIMDADVAGVSVSTQFSPEIGLTAFYARPYDGEALEQSVKDKNAGANTKFPGDTSKWDEMDMFGLTLPIKTSGIRATPWAMGAMIGKDSGYWGGRGKNFAGTKAKFDNDVYGYWFGTTFDMPMLDPFILKLDAMAGGLKTGDSDSDTFGYFVAGKFGYKFDFGSVALQGWYSSGDKKADDRGQMPIVSDDTGFGITGFGLNDQRWRTWDNLISANGIGMWGVGIEIANVSFVDNLSHRLRAAYMRGTNEGDTKGTGAAATNFASGYLLTSDSAYEINLDNTYKVSENLTLALDFAWLDLRLSEQHKNHGDTHANFATVLGVQYAF